MDINYDDYPLLTFPNSVLDSDSGKLPFQTLIVKSDNQSIGFKMMILNIIEKFSKGNMPKRYFVTQETLSNINNKPEYGEFHFNAFINSDIKTEIGNILLADKKTFLYLALNKSDTLSRFNIESNYFGVSYFTEDILEGYEEVFISETGLEKGNSMYKNPGYEGRLLAFAIKCLSIAQEAKKPMVTPKIQEKVFSI